MIEDAIDELLEIYCPEEKHSEEWDIKGLKDALYGIFAVSPEISQDDRASLREALLSSVREAYERKEKEVGDELIRYLEKVVMLQVIDSQWKDHLLGMDHLKEGIGLRGYGQKDPLVEYKKEAFEVFAEMTARISTEIITRLFKMQVRAKETLQHEQPRQRPVTYNRGEGSSVQTVRRAKKVGRNDLCPCGSGRKFKKCCGKNA
jgi:preprotein translocase subunit SecA